MAKQYMFLVILGLVLSLGIADDNLIKLSDGVKCDYGDLWTVVDYGSENIIAPMHSANGIRANHLSCLSIPIKFIDESSILINAYIRVSSEDSGIEVLLFEKDKSSPYKSYIYKLVKDSFESGWYRLGVPVDASSLNNIYIVGYSLEQEIVVIDSIQYGRVNLITPNDYLPLLVPNDIISYESQLKDHHHKKVQKKSENDIIIKYGQNNEGNKENKGVSNSEKERKVTSNIKLNGKNDDENVGEEEYNKNNKNVDEEGSDEVNAGDEEDNDNDENVNENEPDEENGSDEDGDGNNENENENEPDEGDQDGPGEDESEPDEGDENESDEGDEVGPDEGDEDGPGEDENGPDEGDEDESDEGDEIGPDEGDEDGSDEGDEGDEVGPDEGDEDGSDEGDEVGPDEGDEDGSDEGDEVGPDEGDEDGSDEGDEVEPDEGEEDGPDEGDENGPGEENGEIEGPEEEASKEEDGGFWTVLTISIVSVGGAMILIILVTGAYYAGTLKSKPVVVLEDIEPPKTIIIPRVKDVYNSSQSTVINFN